MSSKILIIGISGVTCGGKTTLAYKLNKMFPTSKLISQDDYFLDVDDPRHTWITELNHINFDILSSLDMEKMENDIRKFTKNKKVPNICNDSNSTFKNITDINELKHSLSEKLKTNWEILIVEGFSIFNCKALEKIFHLKYYFTLSKEECFQRRSQRIYEPPDCPGYFEKCVWPEHTKQLEEVQTEVEGVVYLDGRSNRVLDEVLVDMARIVGEDEV
jgi:nicotinamide/nicotinate riboside kinase